MRWRFRRREKEDELDEEILAHLALEVKRRIEAGEEPQEAECAARCEFGRVALVKEVTRATWGTAALESLAQDLRYALRSIRKAPGFTSVAVLTLALGIGANTAIFSIVDAALLRPLPFPQADRLVRIFATKEGIPIGGPSALDMRDFARASRTLEGLVTYDHWRKNVSGIAGSTVPEEMVVGLVPGRYFDVLRIRPLAGRLFTDQEGEYGKHFVAAISGTLWRTRFASDPGVIGRTLPINGETYTIVGVMPDLVPAWMDRTSAPISIWTPFAFPNIWSEASRGARDNNTVARLKPDVTCAQARAEIAGLAAGLASEHPIDRGISATVEPLIDTRAGPVRPVLMMLAAAVGMVLVIACANLAGLLLARNSVRYREIGMRAALGASRWRLVRQLLLEAMLLSVAGAAVGLMLAATASAVLLGMSAHPAVPYTSAANSLPLFRSGALEPRVVLFTLAICIVTALLFGVAPALTSTRVSLADTLREGGRTSGAGIARQRFRRGLVIAEMALSLVLVVAAGLLARSVMRLQTEDPGFRPDHLLKAHLFLPATRYPDSAALTRFCDELARRLRAIPGVRDASITSIYPPYIGWNKMFSVEGRPASRIEDVPTARFGVIDTAWLRIMGIPVISGRDFAESDTAGSLPVTIVNEAFVRRWFPAENPIGRRIRLGPPAGVLPLSPGETGVASGTLIIVGVVRDFLNAGMGVRPDPQILTLFRQQPAFNYGFKEMVVRTATDPRYVVPEVSRQLRSLDAEIPLGEVQTMPEVMSADTADVRFTTVLLGVFAALGILLAVIGAYGVISYLVAQRRHEMGVRIAVGADGASILWLVLRQGISMGLAGVALGICGALLTRQFLVKLLYGVSAADPWTIAGASLLIVTVAVMASAVPALRAMRIDPIETLRNE